MQDFDALTKKKLDALAEVKGTYTSKLYAGTAECSHRSPKN
jgi:hypothetical protein